MEPTSENVRYEFGPYLLDTSEGSLTSNGATIALPPKALQLLTLLIEQAGRTVDKRFLIDTLWPNVFVEESSLTQLVFQLRKTLRNGSYNQLCIETVPKRGYRFAAEVKMLRNACSVPQNGHHAEVESIHSRKNLRITLAFLIGLTVVVISVFAFRYSRETAHFKEIHYRKLTSSGRAMLPALSPDGSFAAYVEIEGDRQTLWAQQTSSTSRVQVVAPAEVRYLGVTYDPAGQSIYYVVTEKDQRSGVVYQVSALGGTPRHVLFGVDSPVTFSPDGSRFAFVRRAAGSRESTLMVANADGTGERKLSSKTGPASFAPGPAWSPDGKLIACAISGFDSQSSFAQIVTVRVEDGVETPLGPRDWIVIGQLAWLHDNSGLVLQGWALDAPIFGDQLWRLSYPGGTPARVTKDLTTYEGVSSAMHSNLLATWRTDRLSHISVITGGNGEGKQIRSSTGDNYGEFLGLDWTPDDRIVVSSHGSGNTDLWIMDADGTNQRQLTFDTRRETWPIVSSDGRFIVFTSRGADGVHLWRVDVDGSNRKQLTFGKGETDHALSPDGKWIFFTSFESGKPIVNKMSTEGGTQIPLTTLGSGRATVSPDSKFVACLTRVGNDARLMVAIFSVDGGEPIKLLDRMPIPDWYLMRWTPDGRALAYISTRDGVSNLWSQPVAGGPPKQLTNFTSDFIYRFAWSRDGKRLALDRGLNSRDIVLITDLR